MKAQKNIRFTLEVWEELEYEALQLGLTPNQWVRLIVENCHNIEFAGMSEALATLNR